LDAILGEKPKYKVSSQKEGKHAGRRQHIEIRIKQGRKKERSTFWKYKYSRKIA
jgi:hypothetical protein